MHLGRSYPFLTQFWQAECFFWPGYVPRKLFVQCPLGYGSGWDLLNGGVVTETGTPDWLLPGDPKWHYADPGGAFAFEVYLHKVAESPVKRYSITVGMVIPPAIGFLSYGHVDSPQTFFGGWNFSYADFLPPYSLGMPVPFYIRGAAWSEV